MIISTGMASIEEIEYTFKIAKKNGANDLHGPRAKYTHAAATPNALPRKITGDW